MPISAYLTPSQALNLVIQGTISPSLRNWLNNWTHNVLMFDLVRADKDILNAEDRMYLKGTELGLIESMKRMTALMDN